MISYSPFWRLLSATKVTQYHLIHHHKISASKLHRLRKNLPVSTETIHEICKIFGCGVSDVMEYVSYLP